MMNWKNTEKDKDAPVQQSQGHHGYEIVGPKCGRDKDGNFICVCGKCKPLTSAKNNDRGDSAYNSSNCGNN